MVITTKFNCVLGDSYLQLPVSIPAQMLLHI